MDQKATIDACVPRVILATSAGERPLLSAVYLSASVPVCRNAYEFQEIYWTRYQIAFRPGGLHLVGLRKIFANFL